MVWLANGPMATFRLWFYAADLPGIDRDAIRARIEGYWDQVDRRLAGPVICDRHTNDHG